MLIGIAYFFIGGLDLLHTLSYKGMNIFKDYDFHANKLWIAARFMESITILLGFIYLSSSRKFNYLLLFGIYTVITSLIVISIYIIPIFPTCFVPGEGQTTFKIVSEYVIIFFLLVSLYLLINRRESFTSVTFRYILLSIILTILAELAFTLYSSNYDFLNQVGHYFKLFSFYLIYKAIVKTSIEEPYLTLFYDLKKGKDELTQLNYSKDKFFTIIAHDLKSPFNSIIGLSGLLLEESQSRNDKDLLELSNSLHSASKQAYKLVEDLLQWARVQTGHIEFEKTIINLNEVININVELIRISAITKNISLIYLPQKRPLKIEADKNMVSTALRNTLSNAVKFTPHKGTIKVSTNLKDDKIQILVKDNGVGMKEETIQKLFKVETIFSKNGTDGETGTGLGLMISREFIEKNGGQLQLKSQYGQGTEVIISLPLIN